MSTLFAYWLSNCSVPLTNSSMVNVEFSFMFKNSNNFWHTFSSNFPVVDLRFKNKSNSLLLILVDSVYP